MRTFANGAALCSRGLDVEGEEHDGAVRQIRYEVIVPACCDGRVQEGGSSLSSGGLHSVVITQLEREKRRVM